MQGCGHYGKGLIYYRPIYRLTKLAFLRARTIQRKKHLLTGPKNLKLYLIISLHG